MNSVEAARQKKLALFVAHILKYAMREGISLAEAKEIWMAFAEVSGLLPESWEKFVPEILA